MIKVLVVDDSPVVRRVFTRQLNRDPGIEVVGTAENPYVARDLIVELAPDVLTLDVEMPRMDGLTFLRKLMRHHPMPCIVVSSVTPKGSDRAIEALHSGAVEVLPKPTSRAHIERMIRELRRLIRAAAAARIVSLDTISDIPTAPPRVISDSPIKVVALGASTGGTVALERVMRDLPSDTPGVVISQHMPAAFTGSFAHHLDRDSEMKVFEARDGDEVRPGTALLAPGDHHLLLHRDGAGMVVEVRKGPRVHHQRPSVDVMFRSVAEAIGPCAVGALMTGMGRDGADGLLEMRQRGAHTIAEHESSCVVYGMPKAAVEQEAAEEVIPLPGIAGAILAQVTGPQPAVTSSLTNLASAGRGAP